MSSGPAPSPIGNLRSNLLERRFRASPTFDIVPFDSLPSGKVTPLLHVRENNPELDALLVPKAAGLSVKVVGSEAVALIEHLGSSGSPTHLRSHESSRLGIREVARLVLDQVLEVETDSGFVSGPAALPVVFVEIPSVKATSATAVVSLEALRYAQALPLDDPAMLADRMYRFNRRPISPRLRGMFPTDRSVADRLGLDQELGSSTLSSSLARQLKPGHGEHWLQWHRRAGRTRAGGMTYKLYLSPDVASLRPALSVALTLFGEDDAPFSLKVGRALAGITRSDKLVVYFDRRQSLDVAAKRLLPQLDGLEPQPVPFTADLSGDGLLSWGVDPPRAWQLPGWRHGDASWRAWVTTRLGSALLAARAGTPQDIEPWRFALARVAAEGVDPSDWTPDLDLWGSSEDEP